MVWFFVIAVIPMGILGVIAYLESQATLRGDINEEFTNRAEMQSAVIQTWIAERRDDVVSLSNIARIRSLDPAKVKEALDSYFAQWGIYQNIFVALPNGSMVYNTLASDPNNLIQEEYFKQAMQGTINISQPAVSQYDGSLVFVFASPLYADNGEVEAVVACVLPIKYINDLLTVSQFGTTGESYLINSNGYFLTESRFAQDLKTNGQIKERTALELSIDTQARQEVLDGGSGIGEYINYLGKNVLGAYQPIQNLGWGLIIEQNMGEAFSAVTRLRNLFVFTILGLMAALTICANFVSNGFTSPIKALTLAAQSISEGQLAWSFNEEKNRKIMQRRDETGTLARALDKTLNLILEKVAWYESILDAIPSPISITDMEMNWTFINHAYEGFLGENRAEILGHTCKDVNLEICNTQDCSIARLRHNLPHNTFSSKGHHYTSEVSYILNSKSEEVGHIEVIQDITQAASRNTYQIAVVKQLSAYLGSMSAGRLNFEIQSLPPSNDMNHSVRNNFIPIADSLTQARQMLHEILFDVKNNIEKVGMASEKLATASRHAGKATSQIAESIQEMSKGFNQQSASTSKTANEVDGMNLAVIGITAGSKAQEEAVKKAAKVTEKITTIGGISEMVTLSAQKVEEMGKQSSQIEAIVETIEDIAEQTNLLSLNAAIEAARAGEHGKGFAVVADEVRKLAERSSSATKEVTGLIGGIRKAVSEAIEMAKKAAYEIKCTSEELSLAIGDVSTVVEENFDVVKNLSSSSTIVLHETESIANISEENSVAVEKISAATEEMIAQVEEVDLATQALAQMAGNLQSSIRRIEL